MQEPREVEAILYEALAEIIDEFSGDINEDTETRQGSMVDNGASGVETTNEDNSQPVG